MGEVEFVDNWGTELTPEEKRGAALEVDLKEDEREERAPLRRDGILSPPEGDHDAVETKMGVDLVRRLPV